ncbi:MAG TPA: ribonuclease P protein component 3 [Methanosarcinales archaeon]|nr:ribonuclease P protein component 3 [Methanosarcinales archaeon]
MKFYDFNIHSAPESSDNPEQLALIAKRYGYSGIAITNHNLYFNAAEYKIDIPNFNIYKGIEIKVESANKLHSLIRKYRPKVEILAVHGGNESINRLAVENSQVDILAHPNQGKGNGINHILASYASENKVAIEFNLDVIIQTRGGYRVRALSDFRKNLKLARKYKVPMIITSNAFSVYDIRAPREMIALAKLFGMTKEEAINALSVTPMQIIEHRTKKGVIMEGVEIVD